MATKGSGKRLNFEMPMASLSLKRYIDKAIKDEEFFNFAVENPIGSLKQSGVNIDADQFAPEDFATFFDVIFRLRELIGKKDMSKVRFEEIFGVELIIPDICADFKTHRGFFREWDNRQAFFKQSRFMSSNKDFGIPRNRFSYRYALSSREFDFDYKMLISPQRFGLEASSAKKETFQGYDKQWDSVDAKYNKESTQNYSKNFAEVGRLTMEEVLRGPLINPVDLKEVTARLDVLIELRMKGGM